MKRKQYDEYYSADEVAKIIGVNKSTVTRWREKKIFLEDIVDHTGIYLYSKERVEQLKSVYRKDWTKGGYKAPLAIDDNDEEVVIPMRMYG